MFRYSKIWQFSSHSYSLKKACCWTSKTFFKLKIDISKKECQRNPPDRPIHANPSHSPMLTIFSEPWGTSRQFRHIKLRNCRDVSGLWKERQHGSAPWIRTGGRPGGLRWHPFLKTRKPAQRVYKERKSVKTNTVCEISKKTLINRSNYLKNISILFRKTLTTFFTVCPAQKLKTRFLKIEKSDFRNGCCKSTPIQCKFWTKQKPFFAHEQMSLVLNWRHEGVPVQPIRQSHFFSGNTMLQAWILYRFIKSISAACKGIQQFDNSLNFIKDNSIVDCSNQLKNIFIRFRKKHT